MPRRDRPGSVVPFPGRRMSVILPVARTVPPATVVIPSMPKRIACITVVTLGTVVYAAGCYSFVPVDPADTPRDAEVRTHVERGAAQQLAPLVRPGRRDITGRLLQWDGESLVLEVAERAMDGSAQRVFTQTIDLNADEIVAVEVKRLDRWRTAGAAALIGAAIAGAVLEIFSGEDTGGSRPPPDEAPPELRVPLVLPRFR